MGGQVSKRTFFSKHSGILADEEANQVLDEFDFGSVLGGQGCSPNSQDVEQLRRVIFDVLTSEKAERAVRERKRQLQEQEDELREEELEEEDALDCDKDDIQNRLRIHEDQVRREKKALATLLRDEKTTVEQVEEGNASLRAAEERVAKDNKSLDDRMQAFKVAMQNIQDRRDKMNEEFHKFLEETKQLRQRTEDKEIELVFPSRGLRNTASTLGRLTNLTFVDLSANQISTLAAEVGQLSRLRYLSLAGNRLRELPDTIGELEALEVLYLQDNILYNIPTSFGRLRSLESCHTHGNPLTELPNHAPREDGVRLRDFMFGLLRLEQDAEELHISVIGSPASEHSASHTPTTVSLDTALFGADAQFSFCVHTFFSNQHRLETIVNDGAALINPRMFWCGFSRKVLLLPAIDGPRSMVRIIEYWKSPELGFDEDGKASLRAAEMLQEVVDKEDMCFTYPFNRQQVDHFHHDFKVYDERIEANTALEPVLTGYKRSIAAVEDGSLLQAARDATGVPTLRLEEICLMHNAADKANFHCPHCQYVDDIYTQWRPGDAGLEEGEWKTCRTAAAQEVHERLGAASSRVQ